MKEESYKCCIGHVARCRRGKLGVVTKIINRNEPVWKGIGFDGRNWESKYPEYIANSLDSYIEQSRIEESDWKDFKPGDMK